MVHYARAFLCYSHPQAWDAAVAGFQLAPPHYATAFLCYSYPQTWASRARVSSPPSRSQVQWTPRSAMTPHPQAQGPCQHGLSAPGVHAAHQQAGQHGLTAPCQHGLTALCQSPRRGPAPPPSPITCQEGASPPTITHHVPSPCPLSAPHVHSAPPGFPFRFPAVPQ